ncbi:hypothetical protein GCM10011445_21560 [Pseudocitrobacter faecalis]|uniref:DUF2950 family protein n=1 Tax=Pseudocitrobacter faecalis TaxID=1398493 RepID=UPI0016736082|nr:DUF2950 family protein [Pseudocitrobacter faecalis]GHD93629.1 hypothetical protein GCM10011445_21560 [Pseudocitrobacter faecalis]
MKKIFLSSLLFSLPLVSFAQQQFAHPLDAATAFADAVTTRNEPQLTALLGDDWRQFLPPDGADPEAVARFERDWKISHRIDQQGDTAHINVGADNWQLPLPIVKTEAGWHFDMQAAQDEIITRTIGRNELSAIGAMHAYVDAQEDYHLRKQRYASKLISSAGQQDGLYWPIQPGEAPSPLGPAFSPVMPGEGYHGYRFRIIDSNQSDGPALIAWPVEYGETGVMSFIVSQDDRVYQADFGEETAKNVAAITRFDTQAPWQPEE